MGKKIASLIKPNELLDETYIKTLEVIHKMYEAQQTVYPAEVVSCFSDIEEQKKVSAIFMLQVDFDDEEALYNAINDQLKLVKKYYIDSELSRETDVNRVQILIDEKRKLDLLNITPS